MGVDALGFHFFTHHLAKERLETFGKIFKYLPLNCEKTLLSDLNPEPLKEVLNTLSVDTLQLYPDWPVELLADLRIQFPKLRILKVMSAQPEENNPANDLEFLKMYQNYVDGFLLDSFRRGGTGIPADWDHCANIVRQTPLPVFLAGGLTIENVEEAIRRVNPFGVDVENGVSTRIVGGPLVKNMEKCRDFVAAVKKATRHRS
jgi:phosphoribosylanthranilate isomerase